VRQSEDDTERFGDGRVGSGRLRGSIRLVYGPTRSNRREADWVLNPERDPLRGWPFSPGMAEPGGARTTERRLDNDPGSAAATIRR